MEQVLSNMDEHKKNTRDKKKYRHGGRYRLSNKVMLCVFEDTKAMLPERYAEDIIEEVLSAARAPSLGLTDI
jgi:hypothetical protein